VIVDPNILIAIATVVIVFSITSIIANWVERTMPWSALVSLVIGLTIMGYVHVSLPDGLTFFDIPNAFINIAGMIL